eukprot:TRINITY_DN40926_c0_g1_i2.p1 TRINITY_DN40926_c0_g1~~TRINITY_DN40926_c0_g1_i2.p1  ORF type:complete len:316 (+),score=21.33 TRINITY_DN40926_c0_g1_i2:53-1000(+)
MQGLRVILLALFLAFASSAPVASIITFTVAVRNDNYAVFDIVVNGSSSSSSTPGGTITVASITPPASSFSLVTITPIRKQIRWTVEAPSLVDGTYLVAYSGDANYNASNLNFTLSPSSVTGCNKYPASRSGRRYTLPMTDATNSSATCHNLCCNHANCKMWQFKESAALGTKCTYDNASSLQYSYVDDPLVSVVRSAKDTSTTSILLVAASWALTRINVTVTLSNPNTIFSPTGTIDLTTSTGTVLGTLTPVGGNASFTFVNSLYPGNYLIKAIYSGNAGVATSQSSEIAVNVPEEIGRAVQQECRDRSRMPSSA